MQNPVRSKWLHARWERCFREGFGYANERKERVGTGDFVRQRAEVPNPVGARFNRRGERRVQGFRGEDKRGRAAG